MEAPFAERSTLPLLSLLDPAAAADLVADVADLQLLQRISTRLISEDNVQALYEEILDGAMAIMRSDMGSMQMLYPERGELKLIAYRGFHPESAQSWQTVRVDTGSTCGEALRRQARLVVPDLFATDLPLSAASLESYRRSGIVAVQSTPLVSRAGHILGMISTHWRQPHEPPERALRLLDVLARQAADLIERARAEAAVRQSEDRFAQFMRHLPGLAWIKSADGRYVFANDAAVTAFRSEQGELYGKTDREIFPPETADQFEENDRRAIACGAGIQAIEKLEQGGGVRESIVSKFPIPGANGDGTMVGGVAFDITDLRRAERALGESERRFREMIDALPAAIYTTDADGRLTHFNRAAVEFSGHQPELGTDHWCVSWKLYRPDGTPLPHDQCPMAIALKEGRAIRDAEAIAERPDGRRIWFAPYPTPLFGSEGQVVGGINMLVDITERKAAEDALRKSEERFRSLVVATAQVVWTTDPDGRVVEDSPSWREFTGQTYDEWQGWGWLDAIHPDDREPTAQLWRRSVADKSVCQTEYRVRTAGGEYRWTAVRAVPVLESDGQVREWIGTNTDISARKRVEEELREADRKKDEFLATLAHELRNPLAPIRNSLNLLGLSGERDPAARQILEVMERQVNHMIRLVDDLLEMSRITRNKVELQREPVELAAILRTAVEISQPLIDASRHQLAIALPPEPFTLNADPVRLGQVFANLLNNAAKYTPSGGQIWLSARPQGSEVFVSVRDSGQGIEPEMLERVFDLFTQADHSPGRNQGGLGIGLTLVKSLVELHGGSVVAKSPGLNQGSEFTVRLPLAAAQRAAAGKPAARAAAGALASRRLLVVDDNRDAANSLGRLLRVLGAEVQIAHGGAEALELLEKFRPVTVLLDIGMPGMDGYEVARRVRERFDASQVVLIALTGWGQEEDRRRSQAAGFDHHLVKPVDHGALLTLLAG